MFDEIVHNASALLYLKQRIPAHGPVLDILSDKTAYLLSSSFSAPFISMIVLESTPDETENAILDGILALIRPVMTFTRRPLCCNDQMQSRRSGKLRQTADRAFYFPGATIIRSASSSTMITIFGSFSELLLLSSAQSFHCILSDPGHSAGQTADTASSSQRLPSSERLLLFRVRHDRDQQVRNSIIDT